MEMQSSDPNRLLVGTLTAQEWDLMLGAAQAGMTRILSGLVTQLNQQQGMRPTMRTEEMVERVSPE